MRPNGSDRFVLAAFALLAASSLGLKAAAGPPRDGLMDVSASQFEQQLAVRLRAQHFAVSERRFAHSSTMILGVRGNCRVAARDARDGAAHETLFARDAEQIGAIRYFYRGGGHDHPPAFAIRLGRLETEAMSRLGFSPLEPVPVAVAASSSCGSGDFGLADVRI